MPKLAVIADDLTGSNDTGAQFAKYGMRTVVVLDTSSTALLPPGAEVVVLNTDSRALEPDTAYSRVKTAAFLLKEAGVPHIYKKIDSTLRGNLGAEIEAVLDVFDFDLVVIAPAFPRNGRVTVGGYQLLNQLPVEATEIARDPKAPVRESRLPDLLGRQSRFGVGHVELNTVLLGMEAIFKALMACLEKGDRLITFDAASDSHLLDIALAAASLHKRVLWVGSAGLAGVLPEVFSWPAGAGIPSSPPGSRPVLVVAGSVSSITARQIDFFRKQPGAGLVAVDARRLVTGTEEEVKRCVHLGASFLDHGLNVAVVSAAGPDSLAGTRSAGPAGGLTQVEVSNLVARGLGIIALRLVGLGVEGLVLTGGDTAASVCRALGGTGTEILFEVAPGIPLGRLRGGPYEGLRIVTKAGAFGDDRAICNAVQSIRSQRELKL